jgi:hypothetical protein
MLYQERLRKMSLLSNLFAQGVKLTPSEIKSPVVVANSGSLQQLLSLAYFVAGIVCVIMIIIGGVRYTSSSGDAGGITSAKNTIMYAIIGLIVILTAAAITQLIFDKL